MHTLDARALPRGDYSVSRPGQDDNALSVLSLFRTTLLWSSDIVCPVPNNRSRYTVTT